MYEQSNAEVDELQNLLMFPPITPRRFYMYAPTRRKKFKPSSRQYPNRRTK